MDDVTTDEMTVAPPPTVAAAAATDAFVKLEFDDGEFSPDVDGIDDGS